jgi:hypothetical protein
MANEGARAALIEMITGCWKTQVIGQGVAFGLFDALAEGPASGDALARSANANLDGATRLLRALAVLGLVEHKPGNVFALTAQGALLCRDAPDSLNGMAGHWGERIWESFGRLGTSVQTGEASIPSGPEHFAVMQADPVAADIFNRAMAEGSLRIGGALAATYDFSGFQRLMDVGGGYGALLVGALDANPALAGQVYDLPALSGPANAWLSEQGVGKRVDYLGGSFFEAVPAGADCILLKYILHDWNDERCLTILRNIRAAMAEGTLLIIERIVPETVSPVDADVIRGDLVMLGVGGKERTEAEYHALLGAAGLTVTRIAPIDGNFSAIEARAA